LLPDIETVRELAKPNERWQRKKPGDAERGTMMVEAQNHKSGAKSVEGEPYRDAVGTFKNFS